MQQLQLQGMLSGLVLFLSVPACCAASTPTFADWLASKTVGAVAAVQDSYDYSQPREHETQCIKQINDKNCRCIGGINPSSGTCDVFYFEAGGTCCDARSHSGNSMGNANIEISNCKITERWFNAPAFEAPGVTKYGEYSAQCYLNAASDSCGHPFCDQMVLESSGGIYIAEDIVLTSLPMSPTNNCFSSGAQDRVAKVGNLLGKKGSRQSATAPKPADSGAQATDKIGAKVASAEPAYKSREPNLHSGLALIYFGPMTVNSRVHDVKIDQGWFEYTSGYVSHGPISEFDAEGKHMVDPYTFSLKFQKSGHGSY